MWCVYLQPLTCQCFSMNWAAWLSVFSSSESSGCRVGGLAHTPFSAVFSELCSGGGWHSEERQPTSLRVRERIFSHSSSSSRERCLSTSFSCLQVTHNQFLTISVLYLSKKAFSVVMLGLTNDKPYAVSSLTRWDKPCNFVFNQISWRV